MAIVPPRLDSCLLIVQQNHSKISPAKTLRPQRKIFLRLGVLCVFARAIFFAACALRQSSAQAPAHARVHAIAERVTHQGEGQDDASQG
jgi:hypothetical protein